MSGTEEQQTTQSVGRGPQANILYSVPGFAVPYPDSVNEKVNPSNTIFNWGGVKIAKISPEVVVKFGSHLKGYLRELRRISTGDDGSNTYIGSVDLGPVTDPILESHRIKGPFDSEEVFNNAIINAYQSKAPKCQIKNFLAGMLFQKRHQIVLTHGDLCLQNIIVNDGYVSGILDWKLSGWYPKYWEFSKALYVWKWQYDWIEYLVQILEPYDPEYAVHSFLTETLW
ncbi:hypothetical protein AJ80_05459 [Polytolypa hystricis UAMH7299]|uniref:Aminoglycoside phosphotransferase domain-containing protein n=1 Tax=Polytolypa hystricis (strain UAMH7299) TaxID=1447883 RepID=A0A2B7Y3X9_POLH7|nr:hypothetical protein AJ80_05459 [Polytolypa hystricis UAMH7299]